MGVTVRDLCDGADECTVSWGAIEGMPLLDVGRPGASFPDIVAQYPVKIQNANAFADGIGRSRVFSKQGCKVAFDEVRKGRYRVSIGSSGCASAIGMDGMGFPRDYYLQRTRELDDYRLERDERAEISAKAVVQHGNVCEPLTALVYSDLCGGRTLYNGCFLKVHLGDIPLKSRGFRTNQLDAYEFFNDSPDGVFLNCAPDPRLEALYSDADPGLGLPQYSHNSVYLSKDGCGDNDDDDEWLPNSLRRDDGSLDMAAVRAAMLPLEAVDSGAEFKNPSKPCTRVWPNHVAQSMFHCMSLHVKHVDYMSTFFESETLKLMHIYHARIHRSERIINEMRTRLLRIAECLVNRSEPQKAHGLGLFPQQLLAEFQPELVFSGSPQEAQLDPSKYTLNAVPPAGLGMW